MKPKSYAPNHKILLNSKFFKTKRNQKLKVQFFELFQVLQFVEKQAYKLEFFKKWKI